MAQALQKKMADLTASIPASNRWKLNKDIDFENTDIRGRTVQKHLGRIAAEMTDWEDAIADNLGLTASDIADIMDRHPRKPSLQRYDCKTT